MVRYRVLSPAQVDEIEALAAGDMEQGSTIVDLNNATLKAGLERMVAQVSDPIALVSAKSDDKSAEAETVNAQRFKDLKWREVTPGELSTEWNKIFTARDTSLLRRVFQREHVVSEAEVEAVLSGKVLETQ